MGTILRREDNKGNISYQAKVRKVGFPIISKTFPLKTKQRLGPPRPNRVLAIAQPSEHC